MKQVDPDGNDYHGGPAPRRPGSRRSPPYDPRAPGFVDPDMSPGNSPDSLPQDPGPEKRHKDPPAPRGGGAFGGSKLGGSSYGQPAPPGFGGPLAQSGFHGSGRGAPPAPMGGSHSQFTGGLGRGAPPGVYHFDQGPAGTRGGAPPAGSGGFAAGPGPLAQAEPTARPTVSFAPVQPRDPNAPFGGWKRTDPIPEVGSTRTGEFGRWPTYQPVPAKWAGATQWPGPYGRQQAAAAAAKADSSSSSDSGPEFTPIPSPERPRVEIVEPLGSLRFSDSSSSSISDEVIPAPSTLKVKITDLPPPLLNLNGRSPTDPKGPNLGLK
jgi:hypothetical protein